MEVATNKPKRIQRKEVPDYSFCFNQSRFSDRTLQIVISTDPQQIRYVGAIRPKEDDNKGALQKSTKKPRKMGQESSSDGSSSDETMTHDVRTLQVNSAILAESSQFFNKLFTNGMRESEQRQVTIHISPSEEQAFMYLLKFMYSGTIETQSAKELLDVLKLADKFEVASCIHGCSNALDTMPMTMEFASLFLCLPSNLLTTDVMRPIVKAAEGFIVTNFSEIKFAPKYMNLPLHIIEVVLRSDEMCVPSEDDIYDFAIRWVKRHYLRDERRKVFQNKLIKLIRFPHMTDYKLAEILSNEDMYSARAMKLVSEALNFKRGSSSETYNLKDKSCCERSYKLRPIRAIEFHTPKREYRVFWDFNNALNQSSSSQTFYMWGRPFNLRFLTTFVPTTSLFLSFGGSGRDEVKHPQECVVFLRSKLNLSNDFCEVSRRKLTFGIENRSAVYVLNRNIENYIFNNVIHMQIIFT